LVKLRVLHSHLPHKFFEGRLWRTFNCWLFLGLLLLLDWWRNVWSAWASSILEGRSRLLLLLLRARPSEIRVIPPSRVVSVAGEVVIVLLWLILLLRLRRSIVNVCSISFELLNCSRLLHGRAKVCMVVSRGAQTTDPCDRYRFLVQGQLGYQVNQCIQFAFKLLSFR